MSPSEVRTRIAPSPTGDPHVGTAYQALFNYAFAKGRGGRFILRIEDTDQARSTPESERAILASLRWLGLSWDEGPDVGGPLGPYRQSERTAIYREQIDRLLAAGEAYRCFCTRERLAEMRSRQGADTGYDRHCREIPPEESDRRAATGEEFVVRMKVPLEGECVFHDLLRGEIHKDWASVDDQIIMKSDAFPTYHLANVVDDHLMGITHVIRGEEWINSVPKHVKLYEQLGWEPPVFCHLPLLRNKDQTKSKLSKRKNPTSINYYRRAGYLPEAMLNFLGMMGWLMPSGEEKFTLEQMVANLKLEDISLGGPVFDVDKLRWLNGRYLREDYTPETLQAKLTEWALNPETFARIVPLVQPRLETLADWGYLTAAFFADRVPVALEDLKLKGRSAEELVEIFQFVNWRLEQQRDFSAPALDGLFRETAERLEIKLKEFGKPFYVALSGRKAWTPLFDSMEILGPDIVRMRLRQAIELLGGISGKRRKALEKQYAELFGPRT
ncbi:MAG: glutamate--tRNA ligase [Candidatus Eisenbacteria sp.]|nr:glutamate--tRNA ligase [Candidatus Eisenbacteria bacterium]